MRILVADDDAVTRKLLKAGLTRWGYEVTLCPDGEEAWQVLQEKTAPNLLLVDWVMPGMDGVELCRRVRSLARQPYVYIILLTGRSTKEDVVLGLEAGADDYLTKPFDPNELKVRLRAGARIIQLQEDLVSALQESKFEASHDPLTQIWNRAGILGIIEKELARAHRERTCLGVVLADIDHFKRVNDRYGHLAGDAVLREVARRVAKSVRVHDSVGRYGGEEFIICLPRCNVNDAASMAERLRLGVGGDSIASPEGVFDVSISLGVASAAQDMNWSVESLVRAADTALYRAKNRGRNRVESWEDLQVAEISLSTPHWTLDSLVADPEVSQLRG